MRPYMKDLILQGAASVRSLLSPTSPKSPTTTLGKNLGTDAESNTTSKQPQRSSPALEERAETNEDTTPPPQQEKQLPATTLGEPAGITADSTPTTPLTPGADRDVTPTDADSDTTIVGEESETASENRRRKRREKVARQRNRVSGAGSSGENPASSASSTPSASQVPRATPATSTSPATEDEVGDEGGSPRGRATARNEDIASPEGGLRVDSRVVEGDAEAGGDQIQIVKVNDGKKVARMVVTEVEEEDDEEESQDRGDATHSEPRLADPVDSNDESQHNQRSLPYPEPQLVDRPSNNEPELSLSHPGAQLVDPTSTITPQHDERRPVNLKPQPVYPTRTEVAGRTGRVSILLPASRLVNLTSTKETERTTRRPVLPEPQPIDATSITEPDGNEQDPARPEFPLVNLVTSIFALVRTEPDPRCSIRRLAILHTRNSPRTQTVASIKQLYPKYGLGPTIHIPSESFHPFIIDSLDSLNTTPKPRPTLEQPCPSFPVSLERLQDTDLVEPLRAAHMSATAHRVLADRLRRTVRLANYFLPKHPPPGIDLPQKFQSLQQAAVENAVSLFLSRTKKDGGSESRAMRDKFTRANRTMAVLLHLYLSLGKVMTSSGLFEVYAESYGRGGEEGVDWEVDLIGLGALFDGGGKGTRWRSSFD